MPELTNQDIAVSIATLQRTTSQLKEDVQAVKRSIDRFPCAAHELDLAQLKAQIKIWVVILWALAGAVGGIAGAVATTVIGLIMV